ncbi:hypothetical protein JKF63_07573 [Porcisia hertigi]|uniref:non-specific serine/threonine protein kinase n=1 Tax=Porcisia hertigi TaxID=2761500 RepID=A0A836LMI0_9TRYP|nr:hypothetical protein JKF63_07573 [Porcisia hertigi]
MEKCFEWMLPGEDMPCTQSGGFKASRISTDEDVPVFLREDAGISGTGPSSATAASGSSFHCSKDGAPAFLAVYPSTDVSPGPGDSASLAGSPRWDETLQKQPPSSTGQGHILGSDGRERAASSTVLYADQPSAAVLHFTADSGCTWDALHRVRILGKGNYGCATLYSTKDDVTSSVSPSHAVVVKDINMQTMVNPAEEVPAVQNELKVLRTVLGHPNLVQYVDAFFDTRPPNYPVSFILMEYCAGGDLAAVIDGRRPQSTASGGKSPSSPTPTVSLTSTEAMTDGLDPLTEPHVASLLIQTAVALQSLHTEYGILHRDVKPHNIFLLEDGVTVRLGDFGIATQLSRVGDKAKEACGSPFYMAPELFEERAYGAAADVWSLGVVFYQLIARQLPFVASSAVELRSLVCRGRCTPLHELHNKFTARYSHQLKSLVSSLLTVDEAARPTLRRILRHKYVREYLKYVPVSVLTAQKPQPPAQVSSAGAKPSSLSPSPTASGVYATVFGGDVVAQAVAQAVHAGVSPIVNRVCLP